MPGSRTPPGAVPGGPRTHSPGGGGPSTSTDRRPVSTWRILRHPPRGAAWNMAVDEALARRGKEDEGVLRIYRWARPSLSFGRNQRCRERYDPLAARAMGVEVVRRPTGGREVLHDRELTYSVSVSLAALGGLRSAYRTLNHALVQAVRSLGVPAGLATPGGRTPPLDAGACFQAPAQGEVEVAGRKLVGSAQVRIGDRLLQHGSLLLGPSSVALTSLELPSSAGAGGRSRTAATAGFVTMEEVLGVPLSFPTVAAGVEAAMAGTLGGRWVVEDLRPDEKEVAAELLEQYESPIWTWRR